MGVIRYDRGEMAEEGSRQFSWFLRDGCLCQIRVKFLIRACGDSAPLVVRHTVRSPWKNSVCESLLVTS